MSEVFFIFVLLYINGIKMNKSIMCKNLVPSILRDKNMNKMLGTFYHQVYIGKVMMLRK